MRTTVVILLDAFRWDYLSPESTPFLNAAAGEGRHYASVVPSPGFCERAEILTGSSASESGFFTAIGYDPERSPYRRSRILFGALDKIDSALPAGLPKRALRWAIGRYSRRAEHGFRPYRIPFRFLPYFCLTEDYWDHRDPRAFRTPSLISLVRDNGGSTFYDAFTALGFYRTTSDEERLRITIRAADQGHSLYLVYVSEPDALGHRLGPDHAALRPHLARLDRTLSEFSDAFRAKRPDSRFVVVGDHGMHRVQRRLDVEHEVRTAARELGLEAGTDYLYFLDSTMLRVWSTHAARSAFFQRLSENEPLSEAGQVVSSRLAAAAGIPFPDRLNGDLLWWANPGVLIEPDFFHRGAVPVRGMHGYDPSHPDSHGCCIVFGPGVGSGRIQQIRLADVFSLIKESLDV